MRRRRTFSSGGALVVAYRIAEKLIKFFLVSSDTRNFNSVADCSFNTAGRGVVSCGNFRIKLFCHCVYKLSILYTHNNSVAQILITLDIGRNTDRVNCLRYGNLKCAVARSVTCRKRTLISFAYNSTLCKAWHTQKIYALVNGFVIAGLYHKIIRTELHTYIGKMVATCATHYNNDGTMCARKRVN